MDILNIIDNTLGRFLYLGVNIAMIALPIYAIFKAIQYFKNQNASSTEDAEFEFYKTATEIDDRLQWDKEKEIIRKSNDILLHLIQDEHREEGDLFLFSEPGPKTGSQPDQEAAQAVRTACHTINDKGQGEGK